MAAQVLYALPGFATETYPIPSFIAKIPWSPVPRMCSGWIGKSVTIPWDETKTTIMSARLILTKIHSDGDPVDAWVRFNGNELRRFQWGEGTKCTEQSDIFDVPVLNGPNLLEIYACKLYPWFGVVNVSVSAYVEVTYEGAPPERPWWEALVEWLKANWPWVALGVGGALAVVYIASPRGG